MPMDDGSAMDMGMTSFPLWLRVFASAVMVAIVALHVWHLRREIGLWRFWHGVHVAMAVGMAVMWADPDVMMSGAAPAVLVGYLLLAAAAAVTVWLVARAQDRLDLRWIAATVGLVVMALMFAPMSVQGGVLGTIAIAYLLIEAVGWLAARWWQPITEITADLPEQDRALAGSGAPSEAESRRTTTRRVRVTTIHTPLDVRLTLAVMALGMAGMLAAM